MPFISSLPEGVRRILRKIAEGEMLNLSDTTTLLDPTVVEEIKGGKDVGTWRERLPATLWAHPLWSWAGALVADR